MDMDLCTLYISPRECGMGELLVKRVESTWECPVFMSKDGVKNVALET